MSGKQEFIDGVRRAAEDTPYAVTEQPYGFDLTVDVAGKRWLTLTAAHRIKRVFTHEVHLQDGGRYGITDVDNQVSYGASAGGGTPRLTAQRKFSRGRVMSYSRRIEFGVDADTGKVGKVVDYSFRAGEGRDLIRGVAKELGWKERMNAEQRGALWVAGITVVLLVVAIGANGIKALID